MQRCQNSHLRIPCHKKPGTLQRQNPVIIHQEVTVLWVTRSHVHVDRVACPWLIRRFIDNRAEFLFVPANQIGKVVRETGATPFDAPSVELGHVDGRCSFESIILKYDLKDPALLRMAKIVHAADVAADIETDEIARGLDAIARGYSLRYPDDERKSGAPIRCL
jgi:hypothetical protein